MSRPSSTPPPRAWVHSRWRRTSSLRTPGLAATSDTARFTSGPRISMVASTPSTVTASAVTSSSTTRASFSTGSVSAGSIPRRSAANVTARYMAPVSR